LENRGRFPAATAAENCARECERFANSRVWIFAVTALGVITLLAASASFRGAIPLDARTHQDLTNIGVHFELSRHAILLGPFCAIFEMIAGAPDYRLTAGATLFWLFFLISAARFWRSGGEGPSAWRQLLASCGAALAVCLAIALYLGFAVLVPLPSWSLVVADRTWLIADLHSHTSQSHDGIASCEENLAYHRERGYTVVAITEHFSPMGRLFDQCNGGSDSRHPQIVPGVELSAVGPFGGRRFLLALGVSPGLALPYELLYQSAEVGHFIASIHEAGGAVLALAYRLGPRDVEPFADAGIDGVEIANFGHPYLSGELKNALLEAQLSRHLALVADSDWHGWSGFARTWTLIKPADAPGLNSAYTEVIRALRARDSDRVIPVVLHPMGAQSLSAAVVSPINESIRYFRELSPPRLLSWWVWTLAVTWLGATLASFGYRPVSCLGGAVLMVLAVGMLIRGGQLIASSLSAASSPFQWKVGTLSCGLGLISLLLASAWLMPALRMLRSRIALRTRPG